MRIRRVAAAVVAVCAGVLSGAALAESAQAANPSPHPLPSVNPKQGKTVQVPKNAITYALGTSDGSRGDGRSRFNWTIVHGTRKFDYGIAYNLGEKPLTLHMFGVDAVTDTTGNLTAAADNASRKGVGQWISPYAKFITIPAKSSVIVPFQIAIPKNAAAGDHGGALVVATIPSSKLVNGQQIIQRETRIAMPAYVRVAGALTTRVAFSSFKATFKTQAFRPGFGDVTVKYSIVNTGNVRVSVLQQISLRGFLGAPNRTANPAPVAQILPDSTFTGTVVFKHVPAALSIRVRGTAEPRPLDPGSPVGATAVANTRLAAVSWSAVALASMGVTIVVLLVLIALQLVTGSGVGLAKSKKSADKELASVGSNSGENQ